MLLDIEWEFPRNLSPRLLDILVGLSHEVRRKSPELIGLIEEANRQIDLFANEVSKKRYELTQGYME